MSGSERSRHRSPRPRRSHDRPWSRLRGLAAAALCLLSLGARADGDTQPLKDVLDAIARSGIRLIYSSATVTPDLRVRSVPPGPTTPERLRSLLQPFALQADPLPGGGYVIVAMRQPATASLAISVSTESSGTEAPVPGATVSIPESGRRTRTDRNGRAEFTRLAAGTCALEVRAEGFRVATAVARVEPSGSTTVSVRLVREIASLDEVVVQTSRYDAGAILGVPIGREALEENPVTSTDAGRALQLLPGSTEAGYTARTHVRGSRDDETLFRYDGVTLTNPYHLEELQSLFSAIDPATVDSVTSWTGVAPIQFGGRIGAVVDIEPRRISTATIDARASTQGAGLFLGTPFANDEGSVFVAARAENSVSPAAWVDQDGAVPYYDDLVARATWAFGPRTRAAAGVLGIDDRRDAYSNDGTQSVRLASRELYSWLRLTHDFLSGIRSETLLSSEDSTDFVNGSVGEPGIEVGALATHDAHDSYTVREELSLPRSPRWSGRIGAERVQTEGIGETTGIATYYAPFVPALQPAASFVSRTASSVHAIASALYADIRWKATDSTIADLGARRDRQQYRDQAGQREWNLRMNVRQRLGDATTLRGGWGQVAQADVLEDVLSEGGSSQPAPPRRLTQSNVSLEQALPRSWNLRVEAYRKRESAPVTTYENVFSPFSLVPEIGVDQVQVVAQRARMQGIEATIESDRAAPWIASLSYTRARAEDLIASQWTPRSWDQPNALQLRALWQGGPWHVSAVLSWHNGWPYTPLLVSNSVWRDPTTVSVALAPRNSARLDDYLSLDLRATWERPLWGGVLQASIELLNATNSKSTCCVQYSVVSEPGGLSSLASVPGYWLKIMPIIGVRWRN
jgi:hypothetical protein